MSNERPTTAQMATALTQKVVRPVLIGRFDILTDPVTAWTGPGTFLPTTTGDSAMDGQIFTNIEPFMEVSTITEDQGIGGPVTITMTGQDLDEPLLQQVVRDKRQWLGRKAWLWLGLLEEDEFNIVPNPLRIKTGVITSMVVRRGDDGGIVIVTIDQDLGLSSTAPFRWIDHARIFAADKWSTYVVKLANKPQGFESENVYNTQSRRDDRYQRNGTGRAGQRADDR